MIYIALIIVDEEEWKQSIHESIIHLIFISSISGGSVIHTCTVYITKGMANAAPSEFVTITTPDNLKIIHFGIFVRDEAGGGRWQDRESLE